MLCKDVLRSFEIDLGDGKTLPASIQWMPPGLHQGVTGKQGDKTVTRNIVANEAGAQRMNTLLQELRAKAARGDGDLPFFDFNHDDREAAFHPTEFFWGGDDKKNGGIRAKGEWTGGGGRAVLERTFRRFSPAFHLNAKGEVISAPINMGGLVNRAAFQTIQPLFTKAADPNAQTIKTKSMEGKTKTPTTLDEAMVVIAALQAQQAESESAKALQAKDARITQLEGEVAAFKAKEQKRIETAAKAIVAKAVVDLKIGAKDTDTQKHYEALYIVNPEATEAILTKMDANPAFKVVVVDPNPAIETKDGDDKKDEKKEPESAASIWTKKK